MSIEQLITFQIEDYSIRRLCNLAEVHEGCISFIVEFKEFKKHNPNISIDKIEFKSMLNRIAKELSHCEVCEGCKNYDCYDPCTCEIEE